MGIFDQAFRSLHDAPHLFKQDKISDGFQDTFSNPKNFLKNASDPGSILFGGATGHNSLGQKRDGTKGGLFGDKQQGIDWFGSPVTAGTNSQGAARLAAIIYGAWAGAGALGATGAGGGGASSSGAAGGAEGGLGGLGGEATTGAGGSGASGASASSGSSGPLNYLNWARRGLGAYNMLQNMGGGGQGQPQMQGGGYPMRQQPQQQGYGSMGQKPLPGSGPFDWLHL